VLLKIPKKIHTTKSGLHFEEDFILAISSENNDSVALLCAQGLANLKLLPPNYLAQSISYAVLQSLQFGRNEILSPFWTLDAIFD